MDLKEASIQISEKLDALRKKLYEDKEKVNREIADNLEDLKAASAKGDHSENAAFTNAIEKLGALNGQLALIIKQISEIEAMDGESRYKPIGMVVYFTTMLLQQGTTELVLKLYPGEISAIEDGVLAEKCELGRAIWNKEIGDVVTLTHRVTGNPITYKIVDMY